MHSPVLIWVAVSVLIVGQTFSPGGLRHLESGESSFLLCLVSFYNHLLWVIGFIALAVRPGVAELELRK